MTPRVIGIAGPSGSGKTTLAERLQERIALDSARMSLADPIRGMLRSLGLTAAELTTGKNTANRFGHTARYMLQTLGTEWGRQQIAPDLWVTVLAERVAACHAPIVLVDDVRFGNEAAWVRSHGNLIHLETHGAPVGSFSSHVSEFPIAREAADIVAPVYTYDLGYILMCLGFDPYTGTLTTPGPL
jgi:energy-coupling factor transporter ATP-binding protein EcfA2